MKFPIYSIVAAICILIGLSVFSGVMIASNHYMKSNYMPRDEVLILVDSCIGAHLGNIVFEHGVDGMHAKLDDLRFEMWETRNFVISIYDIVYPDTTWRDYDIVGRHTDSIDWVKYHSQDDYEKMVGKLYLQNKEHNREVIN